MRYNYLQWNGIIWNEIALFGIFWTRNVPLLRKDQVYAGYVWFFTSSSGTWEREDAVLASGKIMVAFYTDYIPTYVPCNHVVPIENPSCHPKYCSNMGNLSQHAATLVGSTMILHGKKTPLALIQKKYGLYIIYIYYIYIDIIFILYI